MPSLYSLPLKIFLGALGAFPVGGSMFKDRSLGSFIYFAYVLCISLGISGTIIYRIKAEYITKEHSSSVVTRSNTRNTVNVCDATLELLLTLGCLFCTVKNAGFFRLFDRTMRKFDERLHLESRGFSREVKFLAFMICWFGVLVFDLWNRLTDELFPFILIGDYFAQTILCSQTVSFVKITGELRARFRILNTVLLGCCSKNGTQKHKETKDFDEFRAYPLESTLNILSQSHWDLCLTLSRLNDAFGTRILFVIFYTYIRCIVNPYKVVVVVFFTSDNYIEYMLANVGWILLYFTLAVIILKVCSDTTNEARRTEVIIWDHIDQAHNRPFAENLKSFSVKMSHNYYNFSASGYFTLELSTLSSMLLSVATQLVILMSFQSN